MSDPRDFYGTRAFLTQNLFSLSLIHKWRAARTNVEVAGLDAEITQQDTMATVGLVYLETLRAKAAVHAREADVRLNQELLRLARERKSALYFDDLRVTTPAIPMASNSRSRDSMVWLNSTQPIRTVFMPARGYRETVSSKCWKGSPVSGCLLSVSRRRFFHRD